MPTPTPAPDRGGPVACLGGPVAGLVGLSNAFLFESAAVGAWAFVLVKITKSVSQNGDGIILLHRALGKSNSDGPH